MPRDAVSRTANVERTGRHKWVNVRQIFPVRNCYDCNSRIPVVATLVELLRHHGEPLPTPPQTSRQYGTAGLRGASLQNWLSPALREASVYWFPWRPGNTRHELQSPKQPDMRNLFGILLNQTEIRLYLPFLDLFGK